MVDNPKWEWMDSIFGMIVGTIATILGMLGWINPKFAQVNRDLDEKISDVHARITINDQHIATLKAHHERDRDQLQSIDEKLDRIEEFLRNGKR